MPKAKTKKSVAARMKLTKSGKVKRWHSKTSHMMVRRDRKMKRKLRKPGLVHGAIARTMKRLLGKG